MVHQKTLTFFGVEVPDTLHGSLTELGTDLLTLADLQMKLAQTDLAETTREAKWPAAGLVAGLVVLLSCVPIALVGLAELIVWAEWLPRFGAYLAVAGGFALLAGLLSYLCVRGIARSGQAFQRSQQELRRNLNWIVKVFSESGSLQLRQPRHWMRYR